MQNSAACVSFQVDEFLIEAVSLRELKKVRVGHDGSGPGAGWFLDKIVIADPEDESKEYSFPCNRCANNLAPRRRRLPALFWRRGPGDERTSLVHL